MDLKGFLSGVNSYAEKERKRVLSAMKQNLRKKSDAEIRKMYQIRYDNPKWNDEIISLIEDEASRRGIY